MPDDANWVTSRARASGEWSRCEVNSPSAKLVTPRIRTGDVGWFDFEELPAGRLPLIPAVSLDMVCDVIGTFHDSQAAAVFCPARLAPAGGASAGVRRAASGERERIAGGRETAKQAHPGSARYVIRSACWSLRGSRLFLWPSCMHS
ncbi:hypothetical protein [Clavibacter sp. CFBP 8614]|uniref:hypothetical protein n=1 Tax=unclassified Clavibacter TaxID=2626594 RepID=UPI004042287D